MAQCKDCIHGEICDMFAHVRTLICTDRADKMCKMFKSTADVAPTREEGAECPTCHGTGRIGTTNWLTKNMTKKQIAEEKAQAIAEHEQYIKTEYARKIFAEIETCMKCFEDDDDGYLLKKCEFEFFMRELKKIYAEGKE